MRKKYTDMLSHLKKGISKLSLFNQVSSESKLNAAPDTYGALKALCDKNDKLLIKSRLPGFVYGPFRNVAADNLQIKKSLKSFRLELIAEYPEVLNFNHVAIWARNDDGSLYKIDSGYQCTMSSVAQVLPDPNKAMQGDSSNSVCVHSKREVKPWWQVDFNRVHRVEFVDFYNRKDKWGIRAKSIVFTGFDEEGKKVFQGGRIIKKGAFAKFYRAALPLMENCDKYLRAHGHFEAAQHIENKFVKLLTMKQVDTDAKQALLDLLQGTYRLIESPTPDLPNQAADAITIAVPKGSKHLRVIGYRRKLVRPVKLNVLVGGVTTPLIETLDTDYLSAHFGIREHLWTLQHPHVFCFSNDQLSTCGNIALWCDDFYSGDAFVQRIIQTSVNGHDWATVSSTLDEVEARLALISAQEWLLGESWDETFAKQIGHFLATYRMSQARTVKPLLRANRQLLPAFYEGVEIGGCTAQFLPPVIYTRHGLTIPFEHIDSEFLANRMKRFVDFLHAKLNLQAFPCYGTLLGIYRDGDFLPHDDDIDLAVIVDLPEGVDYLDATKQWAETLRELGVSCRPPTPSSLNLHCYFEDFDMDLFFIYRIPSQTGKVWTHMQGYQTREVTRKLLEPLSTLDFFGYQFYAPAKTEAFLEDRYGEGWVTPDPTYEL
jgi:hypothetical protein